MPRKPNAKKIGLFIIIGFGILIAIFFSSLYSKAFSGTQPVVMYFEESLKGLNVGAPLVFKGVEIGKVHKIELLADADNINFDIVVYANIKSRDISINQENMDRYDILETLIAKGLRARLTSQSMLTGQLIIELEMLPKTKAVFNPNPLVDDDIPEIPTVMSKMGELSQGLHELNLKENAEKINKILDDINKDIVPQAKEMISQLNKILNNNKEALGDAVNNFNETMASFKQGAKAFRNFADYIERHPEAILKGKGGE